MTIGEFLSLATETLRSAGLPEPLNEAHYLTGGILGLSRNHTMVYIRHALKVDEEARLKAALVRRSEGEPLAYILGHRDFYKSQFLVEAGVLIPRPETEHVVESALEIYGPSFAGKILDIGCGSGCIGLSLLKEWPQATLMAVDKYEMPVATTRRNATALGVANRVEVVLSDFADLKVSSPFDLIVANPPYIAQNDLNVEPSVKRYEPASALFADAEGYDLIWTWLAKGVGLINSGGHILMEIGAGQSKAIAESLNRNVPDLELLEFKKDLSGLDRVLVARRRIG